MAGSLRDLELLSLRAHNLVIPEARSAIRDPGATALHRPLGPGSPLRYGRDDELFLLRESGQIPGAYGKLIAS